MALLRPIVLRNGFQMYTKTINSQHVRSLSGISYAQLKTLRKSVSPAVYQAARVLVNCQRAYSSGPGENGRSKLEVSYEELLDGLDGGDVQLFDVREPKELEETGRIPQAVNIPLGQVGNALDMHEDDFKRLYGGELPYEDTEVIFFCKAGIRSAIAMHLAREMGFKRARHYPGGFDEWSNKRESAQA